VVIYATVYVSRRNASTGSNSTSNSFPLLLLSKLNGNLARHNQFIQMQIIIFIESVLRP
jgi:hypothetical protein